MFELFEEPGGQVTYQPPETVDRDEEFERVCRLYPEMRIEMDECGNIILHYGLERMVPDAHLMELLFGRCPAAQNVLLTLPGFPRLCCANSARKHCSP